MRVDWTQFKTFIDSRNLPVHEKELDDNNLLLEAYDGPIVRSCKIKDGTDNYTTYVASYQSSANPSLTDSNGITLQRTKITRTGWHFQMHGIEFKTSTLNSLFNEDKSGNDLGFTTIKYYDNTDTELVAGTQAELDSSCVKTVVTWEADQDIEVIGGVLEQPTPPTEDIRLWVTAIPDLPAAAGGSVAFTQGGVNLRYISGKLDIDGKTPKLLPYNATYHTGKFEMTLKHAAGSVCPVHMIFKLFKENT